MWQGWPKRTPAEWQGRLWRQSRCWAASLNCFDISHLLLWLCGCFSWLMGFLLSCCSQTGVDFLSEPHSSCLQNLAFVDRLSQLCGTSGVIQSARDPKVTSRSKWQSLREHWQSFFKIFATDNHLWDFGFRNKELRGSATETRLCVYFLPNFFPILRCIWIFFLIKWRRYVLP